jgi:large subunit ribosomal protein L21
MSDDFAIIATGGKQYRVAVGEKLAIEKLPGSENAPKNGAVVFDAVLLRSRGGKLEIGAPHVAGAKVEAQLLRNFKDKTKIVFKYHSKTRYKKKKGHRQPHSEVLITSL